MAVKAAATSRAQRREFPGGPVVESGTFTAEAWV